MAKVVGTKKTEDRFASFQALGGSDDEDIYKGKTSPEQEKKSGDQSVTPPVTENTTPSNEGEGTKGESPVPSIQTSEVTNEKTKEVPKKTIPKEKNLPTYSPAGVREFVKEKYKEKFAEHKGKTTQEPRLVRVGQELEDLTEDIIKSLKKLYNIKVSERVVMEVALMTLHETLYGKE